MTTLAETPFSTKGEVKELLALFFPILIISFSSCFLPFIEQLFFARLSAHTMEIALNVNYVCRIFEGFCIALTLMAQVCVGRWHGAQEFKAIGSGVWQFIWFSALSMAITIPANLIYGTLFFKGTSIETAALPYFYFLMSIGFLYPLGISLSCFYLGRGKTRLVVQATLCSQILNIVLDYFLILGCGKWIPPLGLMGKAISTLIAQGGLCLLLFSIFVKPKYAKIFGTHEWRFQPKLFWECIQPGVLRGVARLLVFASWASTARLMTAKGGDYILVLSIGGTLFLFLTFLGDAIGQSMTTVVSHILGAKEHWMLRQAFRSGTLLVLSVLALLSLPLIFAPSFTFRLLFPEISLNAAAVKTIFFGVWVSIGLFTYGFVPVSYILAFKDTKFSVFMGVISWINGYLLMYLALEKLQVQPQYFWVILSVTHCSNVLLYIWRMKHALSEPFLVK
jgi:MATE family multidrug resistance protein